MNQLQKLFQYQNHQVRTIVKGGEPWFIAKDVCEVFGDTNYRRSIARLDDDEKGVSPLNTPGGKQSLTVVNEPGLYTLLFHMQPQKKKTLTEDQYNERVKSLKEFKRWVTHEVIPSIRKHGAYMTPETIEKALLNPDTIINLATQLKDEQQKRIAAEQIIVEQQPKVLYAEAVTVSEDTVLIKDLAITLKQHGLDIGARRLFDWLRDNGYLCKQKGDMWNMPTQKSLDLKVIVIKHGLRMGSNGEMKKTRTPRITGKGQVYFINKILNQASKLA